MRLRKSVSRRLVLTLAVAAAGLAISVPAWATFPGAKGRIAFASNAAGDFDLWTMNPDGSGAVDITPGATAFDIEPDWSPDGTKIAFRGGRVATAEIDTVNANGTGLTQLTSNTDIKDYSPAWSPDGSKLAFASNRNDPHPDTCVSLSGCNIDIFVMPATGGAPVQITFDSGADEFEQFSPDGTRLAYNSDVSGAMAIYTVDLATLAVTKLTPDSLEAGDPDWSPDGTKIAFEDDFIFCKKPKDCNSDIYVMNADGSGLTQLTSKFGDNVEPNWSPTGDKIVFRHETLRGRNPSYIYTMNADGTGATPLIHKDDSEATPDWGSG
jgi:Tol biopolymer transport system component